MRRHYSAFLGFLLSALLIALFFTRFGRSGYSQIPVLNHSQVRGSLEKNIALGKQAPDFPSGLDWFNVADPISLAKLRGKIVLLDFWTFCCINCMHVIPDLKFLEKEFPNQLVVIGVHSAKFENEQSSEKIRKSILRYELVHPVVNDNKLEIWQRFGIQAWPTLVLIDPAGNVVLRVSGEGHREVLRSAIESLISIYREKGTLDDHPVKFGSESDGFEASPLRFPGKVVVHNGKIFIADSNHNRIVVTDLEGRVIEAIGNGKEGSRDGLFEIAEFNNPQGMAVNENGLFVADTEQHLIRKADFKARTVTTVAGTGEQAHDGNGGKALKTAISSPWDLTFANGKLFVAMAGLHQIWALDPKQDEIKRFAGSGREDISDGSLSQSALAQPSGITFDDDHTLYLADSETSSIRSIDVEKGSVDTLVGSGLFDFGDTVGLYPETRLQHPLGVHFYEGKLYVADTYNDVIKVFDTAEKKTEALKIDGLNLEEPGGLFIENNILYIADTNHHRIVAVDLGKRTVREIVIQFSEHAL